jgi:hypothetical protein
MPTTMTIGKPVILVVEDEVRVRMMAVSIAENAGFEALGRHRVPGDQNSRIPLGHSAGFYRREYAWIDGWAKALAHAVRGRFPAKDLPGAGAFCPMILRPYQRLSNKWQEIS